MIPPIIFAYSSKFDGLVHIVDGLQTYCKLAPHILQALDIVTEKYPTGKKLCYGCKRHRMGQDINMSGKTKNKNAIYNKEE